MSLVRLVQSPCFYFRTILYICASEQINEEDDGGGGGGGGSSDDDSDDDDECGTLSFG